MDPLHFFLHSLNAHEEVVKRLLKENANPDIPRDDGETALFTASQNGHEEVVKCLSASGANPFLKWKFLSCWPGQWTIQAAKMGLRVHPEKKDIYQRIIKELTEMEKEWKTTHSTKPRLIKGMNDCGKMRADAFLSALLVCTHSRQSNHHSIKMFISWISPVRSPGSCKSHTAVGVYWL